MRLNGSVTGSEQSRPLNLSDEEFERLYKTVSRFCRRRIHDPDKAQDVVQEVFLSALRGYDGLRDRNCLTGWIFKIARRVCAQVYAGEGIYSPVMPFLEDVLDEDEDGRGIVGETRRQDAFTMLVEAELVSTVLRIRAGLTIKYKDALDFCIIEGFSPGEAAQILELRDASIMRVRLHRVRGILIKRLGERGYL